MAQQLSLITLLRQFVVAMLVLDTWQYFMHRYMHHNKFLYRHIHSQHHRLVVLYAFGALSPTGGAASRHNRWGIVIPPLWHVSSNVHLLLLLHYHQNSR